MRPLALAAEPHPLLLGVMDDATGETWVTETEIGVRSYELDSFGHVNHAVFLNYLEHGRFEMLRGAGIPPESLPARGLGVYVVRLEVDYLKEARVGDRIVIRTRPGTLRRTSMVLIQEIARHGPPEDVLARARVTAVWVGTDRRPTRVPDEILRAFGF